MSLNARNVLSLRDLVPVMRQAAGFAEVTTILSRGGSAGIDGAWGSSCALVAAAAAQTESADLAQAPVVIVLPRISEVDDFTLDLAGLSTRPPAILPAWETSARDLSVTDPIFGQRLRVLREVQGNVDRHVPAPPAPPPPEPTGKSPLGGALSSRMKRKTSPETKPEPVSKVAAPTLTRPLIVTSFPALLNPVPGRAELQRSTRTLRVGESVDPEELLRWFVDRGCERVHALELPGEFSTHGGIVDLFPPGDANPLRIELFGDEIESIRRFDAESQRKLADLTDVSITLLGHRPTEEGQHAVASDKAEETESFLDSLPPNSWIVLVELPELIDEGKAYLDRLDNPRGFYSVASTIAHCSRFPHVMVSALGQAAAEVQCRLRIESIERFHAPADQTVAELQKFVGADETVLIACHNKGEMDRLTELLAESELLKSNRVRLCEGLLLRGFRLVTEKLIVLSDHELFGRRDVRRLTETGPRRARIDSRAIDSFLELNPGNLVVHLTHGIARYLAMEVVARGDEREEEHLLLEFRDNVRMYVPVSLIHLVQKYVGGTKSAPQLSRVGSGLWEKKKQQVASAVADMATDMLKLQAARAGKPGNAFPRDTHWQDEFEAAFPYTETDDQLRAIAQLKEDMQRSRPMDRLICGDVGYGKTEVAMRAAFKAIDAGKQVAVLVPTTVLAEQHYRSFCERMAEFPFHIEVLSRFRTKGEAKGVLEGLASGAIDLVIGTHRIVQADIKFHDLGLLIIDEEQRFGVEHKEMLKRLRLEVDVLTLSATPIPRTLHMSLLGIRDISNLETPPHDRLPIETRIWRFDGEMIRRAMIRELNRGGQIYFVHNRVYNIQEIADQIQKYVPEAKIGIVHGQMGEHELEESMVAFVNGQLDVLVATTIIESGLDIPNANTIFIHQADKYGLADLHQLRGRVGRYKHRAYCYLLLEEGQTLTGTAAKRLKAIEEYSELGAGFKIAMRDLEIRGAGNILGTEQSGHISTVGYELYCQLLEQAVKRLKNEPIREMHHVEIDLPINAYLPNEYVPPGRHKIELYRKLSRIETFDQSADFQLELLDRFGPLPPPALSLFEVKELQLLAREWQIEKIHREERFLVFTYRDAKKINLLAALAGKRLRVVDKRTAYLPVIGTGADANEGVGTEPPLDRLMAQIKALLRQNRGRT